MPSIFILPAYDESQPVVKTQNKNAPRSFDVVPSSTPLAAPWKGSSLVPRRRACVGSNERASPPARRTYLAREERTRRHGGQTCVVHVPLCCSTFREVTSLCTGQADFREHGVNKKEGRTCVEVLRELGERLLALVFTYGLGIDLSLLDEPCMELLAFAEYTDRDSVTTSNAQVAMGETHSASVMIPYLPQCDEED
jgi:hypothetical protein